MATVSAPHAAGVCDARQRGALGFCDPEVELALAYVMNHMGPLWQNPRNHASRTAVDDRL